MKSTYKTARVALTLSLTITNLFVALILFHLNIKNS